MSVKNKGSWCEKHNQYARTKFDCPHCELNELRERVENVRQDTFVYDSDLWNYISIM